MKRLFRINYVILMIAAFYIVYQQAFIQRYNTFYENIGKESLASDKEYKHLFLYEAKGIHQEEPLFTFSNAKINVDFYEVSLIDFTKTDNVATSLFPVITSDKDIFDSKDLIYAINFKRNMTGEESVYPFELFNFVKLDIYLVDSGFGELLPVMTDDEQHDLINKNIISFEVFSVQDDEIEERHISSSFSFNRNSFKIRNELVSRLNEKKLNDEPLEFSLEEREQLYAEKGIIFQQLHNASEYNYILLIWFGGYFTVLVVTGYFVYFFRSKEKRLGRRKPTKALAESIKESEETKRQIKEEKELEETKRQIKE